MSARWIWPGAERGPARLLGELAARGFSVLRGDASLVPEEAARARRRAFEGGARELVRLLVWMAAPLPSPPAYRALAAQVAEAASRRLAGAPAPPEARRRLGAILEMVRGVPPRVLAARERIPEP
ncbi:hypothetical protein WME98_35620 [Sorangium sp. So ce296]|uniref:hypothetical protein n=1 Tax=Sorangium sp. So ce296 TaxID=3133296 RepID=UPI003F63A56C